MKNVEIYIYNRKELEENLVIESKNEKNNIIYITEKSIASLFYPHTDKSVGQISFINNLVINQIDSFNTSIGTIVNDKGSLVFNFNYVLKYNDSKPSDNLLLSAIPTFISGEYSLYSNIKINVQILKNSGERILSIQYDQ